MGIRLPMQKAAANVLVLGTSSTKGYSCLPQKHGRLMGLHPKLKLRGYKFNVKTLYYHNPIDYKRSALHHSVIRHTKTNLHINDPMATDTKSPREFDNSGDKALHVPGFGCSFDFQLKEETRFLHALTGTQYERATAREIVMVQVMDQLTDKPEWRKKVFDDAIVAKWRNEAKSMDLISDKAFEWCITELRDRAAEGNGRFTITLDVATRCVKADGLVGAQLHRDLVAAVQPLLDAPVKDWHPGSDNLVLNLVHPSMYPLVYGKTRVIKSGQVKLDGILEARDDTFIAPVPTLTPQSEGVAGNLHGDVANFGYVWSTKYQWLPCDVAFVNREGLEVKIASYINNLPYRGHEKLYGCIEELISLSIPLWNEVLETGERYPRGRTPLRIVTKGAEDIDTDEKDWVRSLPYDESDVGEEEWKKAIAEVTEYLKKPDREESVRALQRTQHSLEELPIDWLSEWGPQKAAEWKFDRVRRIDHPEPFFNCTYEDWKQGKARPFVIPPYSHYATRTHCGPHTKEEISIENKFRQQGLQVIVKIAGIELTPKKPNYKGGSWHLEGMLNEHIVATAIYYFDVENVTESRIRYRQNAGLDSVDLVYGQDEHFPLEMVFGADDLRSGKEIQEVGSIKTTQGRLLVFPNTRQHKVDPFELVDKTRPGHRRFVVLWLVDPHYRLLSTKNVPPQQHDWWKEKMAEVVHPKKMAKVDGSNRHVPREVEDLIEGELKAGTMSRDEAEQYRLELMAERTNATDSIYHRTPEFNFCEH